MKTYADLNEEIRSLQNEISDLYIRLETSDDEYNDIRASIDELETELDYLLDERNAIVGC